MKDLNPILKVVIAIGIIGLVIWLCTRLAAIILTVFALASTTVILLITAVIRFAIPIAVLYLLYRVFFKK